MSTSLPGTEQPGDHPPPRQISGWLSTEPNVSHYCKGRGLDQCCILHPGGTPASDNADGRLHITRCTRSVCCCESCRPSYLAARVAEAQCQHHHKTSYRCGQVGFGIRFSRLLYYPVTPFALHLRERRIVEREFDRNMHSSSASDRRAGGRSAGTKIVSRKSPALSIHICFIELSRK